MCNPIAPNPIECFSLFPFATVGTTSMSEVSVINVNALTIVLTDLPKSGETIKFNTLVEPKLQLMSEPITSYS